MTYHARVGLMPYPDKLQLLLADGQFGWQLYTCGIVDKSSGICKYAVPVASLALELWTNVCVCATADAKRLVLISSAMGYGKYGDGHNLEQKVTSIS